MVPRADDDHCEPDVQPDELSTSRLEADERELPQAHPRELRELALAAVRAKAQERGWPRSDEAADCEFVERALSDPEIRRWAAYHQAASRESSRHDPIGAAMRSPHAPIDAAWRRRRMVHTHLHALVRTRCGVPDDDRLMALVQAVEFDLVPPIEAVDEAIRRKGTLERGDTRLEYKLLAKNAARLGEFFAERLPAARARVWRAAVGVAALRCSTCRPIRARARSSCGGSRRPGRRAPPGADEDSEGEPAKRPAPADDDVDLLGVFP